MKIRVAFLLFCRRLRAGARVMPQSKPPENAGQPKNKRRGNDEMQHKLSRLSKRFDEQAGWNVRDDHDRNDPAENESKNFRENRVRITRDIEEIKISVDEPLSAHDPKTHRGQAKQDRHWIWHDPEPG